DFPDSSDPESSDQRRGPVRPRLLMIFGLIGFVLGAMVVVGTHGNDGYFPAALGGLLAFQGWSNARDRREWGLIGLAVVSATFAGLFIAVGRSRDQVDLL